MTAWDSRKNNFDFMRLGFAVLVIYSHAFPLGLGTEVAEPFVRATHGQVTGGAIAVNAFFIMSGFLIAASAERTRSVGSFLLKRVRRIYPAFVLSALLTALVLVPLAGIHFHNQNPLLQTGDFLLNTLRLHEFSYADAFAHNPYPQVINGSTWSIAFEFWCYIGVALLTVSGLLRRRYVLLGIFVVAWLVGIAFRIEGWVLGGKQLGALVGPPQMWARLLPLYMAGVVFYSFRERIRLRNGLAGVALAAIVAGSFFSFGWAMIFPLAGAYLLLWFAFTPLIKLHGFGRFGDFSYGAYLYAFPIEQIIMQTAGHTLRPVVLFALATPLTLVCAVASWYGLERKFLEPKRRKETIVHAVHEATATAP